MTKKIFQEVQHDYAAPSLDLFAASNAIYLGRKVQEVNNSQSVFPEISAFTKQILNDIPNVPSPNNEMENVNAQVRNFLEVANLFATLNSAITNNNLSLRQEFSTHPSARENEDYLENLVQHRNAFQKFHGSFIDACNSSTEAACENGRFRSAWQECLIQAAAAHNAMEWGQDAKQALDFIKKFLERIAVFKLELQLLQGEGYRDRDKITRIQSDFQICKSKISQEYASMLESLRQKCKADINRTLEEYKTPFSKDKDPVEQTSKVKLEAIFIQSEHEYTHLYEWLTSSWKVKESELHLLEAKLNGLDHLYIKYPLTLKKLENLNKLFYELDQEILKALHQKESYLPKALRNLILLSRKFAKLCEFEIQIDSTYRKIKKLCIRDSYKLPDDATYDPALAEALEEANENVKRYFFQEFEKLTPTFNDLKDRRLFINNKPVYSSLVKNLTELKQAVMGIKKTPERNFYLEMETAKNAKRIKLLLQEATSEIEAEISLFKTSYR